MLVLRWCAYGAFVGAAICLAAMIELGPFPFLGGALAMVGTGAFFLGLDRMIALLTDINQALRPTPGAVATAEAAASAPPRSIAEIAADLDRLRAS